MSKDKLTITRVALGSLQRRRGQYKAMIIGAGLAIFFVSSLFIVVQSIVETYRLAHISRMGNQDAILRDAERITPEALLESGFVSEVGSVYVIAQTDSSKCPIGYYDEVGAEMASRQVTDGRMPEKPGEICVEPNFLQKIRSEAKVGDEITLSVNIPIGKWAQFLPDPVEKTYRVVGILKPQSIYLVGNLYADWEYLHYPSAIVSGAETVELGGRAIIHRMVRLAPGIKWGHLNAYVSDEYNMENMIPTQFNLFPTDTQSAEHNLTGVIMIVVAGVLGAVLILAASMGIVNAFSGSLAERRTQIGMMRAVGATSRQIRQIFGREALLLALLIAPVSIALSYLFVWGLTKWIGSVTFFSNPWFLPIDVVTSLLCVALAAWVPLMRASKLPPMQAIRDVSLLRARKRIRLKVRQQYDAPQLIAARHLSLYRTRQAGVAVMVALSMLIISIVMPFVWEFGTQSNPYGYQIIGHRWNMDTFVEINMTPHEGLTNADVAEVIALPLVSGVDVVAQAQINLLLDDVTPYGMEMGNYHFWGEPKNDMQQADQQWYKQSKEVLGLTAEVMPSTIYAIEGEFLSALTPYVVEGRIDIAALNAGREVLVIAPTYYVREVRTEDDVTRDKEFEPFKVEKGIITSYENDMFHAGDVLPILRLFTRGGMTYDDGMVDYSIGVEREETTATIGAVLDRGAVTMLARDRQIYAYDVGSVMTSHAGLAALGIETAGYANMGVRLSGAPDDATHAYLTDTLKGISSRGTELNVINHIQTAKDQTFWQGVLEACLLAVSLLMMSMCVSLVNSAITNRVRSDKRSIGTLRAVGASLADIVRSYRLQALAMILWGVVAGLLLSVGYYLWFYGFIYINADVPFGMVALAQIAFLGAVGLFCGINLSLRIREIAKDSIVSNIREL